MGTLELMRQRESQHATVQATPIAAADRQGPGTELTRLLSWAHLGKSSNCSCEDRAKTMDTAGPAWCREHTWTIVDWLEGERQQRGLSMLGVAWDVAKGVIRSGWSKARAGLSAGIPGRLWRRADCLTFRACAWLLVRLAIRLAERK